MPKVDGLFAFVPGADRFTIFSALVDSARNCSFFDSRDPELAEDAHVDVLQAGRVQDVAAGRAVEAADRPDVVLVNAAMLNHCATTSLRGRFGSRNGLPIRSARSLVLPSKFESVPLVTVSGAPLRKLAIARERPAAGDGAHECRRVAEILQLPDAGDHRRCGGGRYSCGRGRARCCSSPSPLLRAVLRVDVVEALAERVEALHLEVVRQPLVARDLQAVIRRVQNRLRQARPKTSTPGRYGRR